MKANSQTDLPNEIAKVIPSFATGDWSRLVLESDHEKLRSVIHRKDISEVTEFAVQAIDSTNAEEAINWIALALCCYPDRAVDEIRRRGVLRCSKYGFHNPCLKHVVGGLSAIAGKKQLPPSTALYFR